MERDLMLIKVSAPPGRRAEISQLTEIFRGRIVDVAPETMIIEIAGQEGKVEAFIEMMRPFGIVEMARTGRIAMVRGKSEKPRIHDPSNLNVAPRQDRNNFKQEHPLCRRRFITTKTPISPC